MFWKAKIEKFCQNFWPKYSDGNQILDQNTDEIASIEVIYGELFKFIEKNSDAKILTRINDIS